MAADALTLLQEARALIETGWIQGASYRNVDGIRCYCAVGALAQINQDKRRDGGGIIRDDAYGKAIHALTQVIGGSPVKFNDTPGRTQGDVVYAFKRAEKLLLQESNNA